MGKGHREEMGTLDARESCRAQSPAQAGTQQLRSCGGSTEQKISLTAPGRQTRDISTSVLSPKGKHSPPTHIIPRRESESSRVQRSWPQGKTEPYQQDQEQLHKTKCMCALSGWHICANSCLQPTSLVVLNLICLAKLCTVTRRDLSR